MNYSSWSRKMRFSLGEYQHIDGQTYNIQLVELLKSCYYRTLAIGYGGNDVRMIQQADIGRGISGREGLQAAKAAEYRIGINTQLCCPLPGGQIFADTSLALSVSISTAPSTIPVSMQCSADYIVPTRASKVALFSRDGRLKLSRPTSWTCGSLKGSNGSSGVVWTRKCRISMHDNPTRRF